MQAHYRMPMNTMYKQLLLLSGFALILIEYESNSLFLWPLDHSCAKPANLSIFSDLFIDAKSQPIDLDAVQRNLFDATPEDAFTLARAKSMGISYDDVSRCFEYSVDYQNDNEPTFNMDSLEPCRYGLRFETLTPDVSIIDHFNLACSRQWLKIFVPQSFALGLLVGFVLFYYTWLPRNNDRIDRIRNLSHWLSAKLAIFGFLYLMTLILNQYYLTNKSKTTVAEATKSFAIEHQEENYFIFVACVFLRAIMVSSITCRILTMWKGTIAETPTPTPTSIQETQFYFNAFALLLVTIKLLYMPIILRSVTNWPSLSRFLTLAQLVFLMLTSTVEYLHTKKQFHLFSSSSPSSSGATTIAAANYRRVDSTQAQSMSSDVPKESFCGSELLAGGGQQKAERSINDKNETTNSTSNKNPRMLLEIDDVPSHANSNDYYRWPNQRFEPRFKACEFCSVKEEKIFRVMNHYRDHTYSGPSMLAQNIDLMRTNITNRDSMYQKRIATKQQDQTNPETRYTADRSLYCSTMDDSSGPYQPTTMPLDLGVTEPSATTTSHPISTKSLMITGDQANLSGLVTSKPISVMPSSQPGHGVTTENGSSTRAKRKNQMITRTGVRAGPASVMSPSMIQHNVSLIELNLRWPLMGELFFLLFFLTFNYFLIQTIPNHKLMHAETISSFMERKINHRNFELVSTKDVQNNESTKNKTQTASRIAAKPGDTNNHTTEFIYNPTRLYTMPAKIKRPSSGQNDYAKNGGPANTPEAVSIKSLEAGPKYEINSSTSESASRLNEQQQQQQQLQHRLRSDGDGDEMHSGGINQAHNSETFNSTKIIIATRVPETRLTFHQIDKKVNLSTSLLSKVNKIQISTPRSHDDNDELTARHSKYKYETNQSQSLLNSGLADLLESKSKLFNYNSVDYATQTIDRLARSWNPFEIFWIAMNLNGWPVELLIILLYATRLTDFETIYFKLNRLFSLIIYGSRLLILEWLIVALIPKQNHLLELEWLLSSLLIVARFITCLMLYSHLHMIFKLGARISSRKLTETTKMLPIVLAALTLALLAPVFEKIHLIVIPLILVASNLSVYYLARSIDSKFKVLLCPMMFE
jgi:hypothetical protein